MGKTGKVGEFCRAEKVTTLIVISVVPLYYVLCCCTVIQPFVRINFPTQGRIVVYHEVYNFLVL